MSIYLASRLPYHKLNKSEHSFNLSFFGGFIALDFFPRGASPQGSTREAAQHGITSQVSWLREARGRKAKATPTASPGLNSFAHLGEVRENPWIRKCLC